MNVEFFTSVCGLISEKQTITKETFDLHAKEFIARGFYYLTKQDIQSKYACYYHKDTQTSVYFRYLD